MTCQARQYSDQMQCGKCGLAWDVNDADPPTCKRAIDRRAIPERRVTKLVAAEYRAPEPSVNDVLAHMIWEHDKALALGSTKEEAMREAVRVLQASSIPLSRWL